MREIQYAIYSDHIVGLTPPNQPLYGYERKEATLTNFFLDLLPDNFYNVIPPLAILNQVLSQSDQDEDEMHWGIGYRMRWNPFEIDEEEYAELLVELFATPGLVCKTIVPPGPIKTPTDWDAWQRTQ